MKDIKDYKADDLPQLLNYYYTNLFPTQLFCKWLSYGDVIVDYFARREFSFTLEGDIYLRYQSFQNADELQKALINRCPIKIDIGAVFNIEPKNNKKNELVSFQALERELIFDIDLTDYDDIRTCCRGANICLKCWKFMIIAAKILDRSLRNDFGFKHLLFVYSGRRGIHCWVNDKRARELTFEARNAIVEYLTLVAGGDFKNKKTNFNRRQNLHPSITYALFIIDQYFPALLNDQGWLDSREKFDQLIELCSLNHFKPDLKKIYDSKLPSAELWSRLCAKIRQLIGSSTINTYFIEEIKIQYAYPRLDVNVSKGVNHLLKSPFSVHPKTGRISVPIDMNRIDDFDPFKVPNISQICDEVDEFDKRNTNSQLEEYEKTSIRSSVVRLSKFINELVNDNKQLRNKQSDETLEF